MSRYRVQPKQVLSMKTRDGVRLDADVYYPEDEGRFPVLLMRQPYGRAIASTVVYAHPTWYGSQGYIVVIQDVRGRGSSEGEFRLFAHEAEDGADAVAWAAQLPGSTGQVGMYGFSYQGMTQLYAAAAGAPALKALAPAMVGYDLYADWAYENGALLLQAGLGWAIQLAAETARLKGDEAAFGRLYAASRQLPLHGPVPARPQILAELAADSFFHDWLDHPQPDDYWQALKPDLSQVDLPMLHVGGWFDPYLRGTLRLYLEKAQGTTPQHLWIGPWGHLPWDRKVGAIDFGPKAVSPIDRLQIRWFDQFLKRKNSGILLDDPVSLFEMGTNQWRSFGAWPDLESQSNSGSNSGSDSGSDSESKPEGKPRHKFQTYYLTSTGLAGMRQDNGKLEAEFPMAPPEPDVLVHDPWRPVPSLGGHAGIPAGPFERSAIDGRSDVLTYTTPPLETALAIAGTVYLDIRCVADTPSFDLCAVLSQVHPDGRVFNLTQGYRRVDRAVEERPQPLTLALQPTCFAVPPEHALRLSLSAAAYPAYAVNAGTGQPAGASRLIDCQTITLTVNPPRSAPSKLRLPQVDPLLS